jgi:CBS domain-containing protein
MKPSVPTARDLMRTNLTVLAPDDTIVDALAVLEDNGVSGAPVVSAGKLVGVLTMTDIARSANAHEGRSAGEERWEFSEPVGEERSDELDPDEVFFLKDDYSPDVLGRERVREWMTRQVIAVTGDEPIDKVCARMVDHQIHRVFVTEEGRLKGVVSTFDVVRHVAGRARAAAAPRKRAKR